MLALGFPFRRCGPLYFSDRIAPLAALNTHPGHLQLPVSAEHFVSLDRLRERRCVLQLRHFAEMSCPRKSRLIANWDPTSYEF